MTTPPRTTRRADGDRAGLIAAHDTHAADLYDYCLWAVEDAAAAEDAVHGALLAAAAQPDLLDQPDRLRPWLYAAARKECLRAARRPGGPRFLGSAAGDEGPAASPQARQRLSLVRRAAAQLGPRDREIAELALRHGLSAAELAAILGTSTASMRAAILRISTELSAICGDDAQQLFFAWHMDAAPAALHARVLASADAPERIAHFARRANPAGRSGLPSPLPPRHRRVRALVAAFGITVLVLSSVLLADDEPTERVALNPVLNPAPAPSGNVSLDIAAPLGGTPSTKAPTPTSAAGRQDLPTQNPPGTPTGRPEQRPSAPPLPPPADSRPPARPPAPGGGSALSGSRSLQSANYPSRYVRHVQDLGRLDPVAPSSPALTKQDATFTVVAGLANPSCYSFRGTGGRYLRHYSFRLRLHADNGTPLFRQDATFCARTGSTTGTVTLESYNYPGRFIRHRNFELWVDPADNTERFRADSAFRAVSPWAS